MNGRGSEEKALKCRPDQSPRGNTRVEEVRYRFEPLPVSTTTPGYDRTTETATTTTTTTTHDGDDTTTTTTRAYHDDTTTTTTTTNAYDATTPTTGRGGG